MDRQAAPEQVTLRASTRAHSTSSGLLLRASLEQAAQRDARRSLRRNRLRRRWVVHEGQRPREGSRPVPAGGSDYPYVGRQPTRCSEAQPGPIGPAGCAPIGALSAVRRPLRRPWAPRWPLPAGQPDTCRDSSCLGQPAHPMWVETCARWHYGPPREADVGMACQGAGLMACSPLFLASANAE
jgi:hypothetical protein